MIREKADIAKGGGSVGEAVESAVRVLVADVIRSEAEFSGLFLVDLVVRGHAGSRVLEVYVDGDDPVPIETITRLSRRIGSRLDTEAIVDGVSRLEVSSPGAAKPLNDIRQYPKHRGKVLAIKRVAPDATGGPATAVSGILRNVDADSLELDVNGSREIIPFNQIIEGKVALPW